MWQHLSTAVTWQGLDASFQPPFWKRTEAAFARRVIIKLHLPGGNTRVFPKQTTCWGCSWKWQSSQSNPLGACNFLCRNENHGFGDCGKFSFNLTNAGVAFWEMISLMMRCYNKRNVASVCNQLPSEWELFEWNDYIPNWFWSGGTRSVHHFQHVRLSGNVWLWFSSRIGLRKLTILEQK